MKSVGISPVDMCFVNGRYPIEFVLFYPYRIQVKSLHKALKKVAALFWPAFGVYSEGEIKAFPELEAAEDDWWKEETIEANFNPAKEYDNLHHAYGTEYLKSLQYSKNIISSSRLFRFKVIHFLNGTMLIPSMNHLAGDGYSYFYLLTTLAALYRNRKIPFASLFIGKLFKPRLTRTTNKNFQVPNEIMEGYLPDENLMVEFIEFKKTEIRKKALHASEQSGLRVSTNDILCAIEVLSLIGSQSSTNPANFHLVIPIDVRRGVSEYGKKFFGNGIMVLKIPFSSAEIAHSTIESIAIHIRKSFPDIDHESFDTFDEKLIQWVDTGQYKKLLPYDPKTDCLVTNLSRVPLKALNFGNGPPSLVAPTTIGRGSTLVMSNKDSYVLRRVRP